MAKVAYLPFLVAMIIAVSLAADDPQSALASERCSHEPIYTFVNVTAFRENQNAVFASFRPNLSLYGFADSMQIKFGKTDPVYGLAVCRKYLSANECSECVSAADAQIKNYCHQSNGGRIHLDGCFLRYENTSFYGQDLDYGQSHLCASTNDSDPQTFSQRATALSRRLVENASVNNGYATGSIDGSLYGLAQCWPTLTNSSCQRCLAKAQNQLLTCLPNRESREPLSGKSSSKVVSILLGSIGGTALIAVMCSILFYRRIRHGRNNDRTDVNLATRENFEQFLFDYEVMREATGNFNRNNMVGKGGFGEVYKGTLPDGRDVAVKKLYGRQTAQAAAEFLTEVKLLTSVRHRNLVRLLGCCTRGHDRLLIYEIMSNNSLDKHLFGEIRNVLSWENRLKIIVGTARGLVYLHEDSNMRIIHRDIKCGNILLDDRFHPKIADFGMARFFTEGDTSVSKKLAGTIGYIAPEYAAHGQLTEKADVYSYGIVVLEIVSGRKAVDARLDATMQILLQWAWNQLQLDQVLDIVDLSLEGHYPREQALRLIKLALLCTQDQWLLRPAMSKVLWMLTNNSEITDQPRRPDFFTNTASSSCTSHGSVSVSLFPR
eukprot:PITA_21937